jgi:hypothetical protein
MTEQQYAIYKKHHPYEDIVGTEEGKIDREKTSYAQHRRKGNRRVEEQLRSLVNQEAVNENEINNDFELPEEEFIAERVLRNARTHKRRLAGLRKRETDS